MPNTHSTLTSLFTDIANAIRAKKGTSADIVADNFPSEIANILSGGGGLPSGITDIKTGSFTVAEAVTSYTVTHGGTTYPKAFLCILENPVNRQESENYSLVMYYYQGFSGATTGALGKSNAGYMHPSTSATGNFIRDGSLGAYGATSSTKVEMSAGSGYYFKPTIKNRITTEIEPAVYRWYAIW